jgi:hypothetical protein
MESNPTFASLSDLESFWEDTPEAHTVIFKTFFDLVNSDPELAKHRNLVEQYNFGYGDRPFHWMWNLIAKSLPHNFKFLEIGVFQGQVISLMSLLNRRNGTNGTIFGVTPLKNVDDAFSKHPDLSYESRIAELYAMNGLNASDLTLIVGLSDDPSAVEHAKYIAPFDCVYIDGGHDYHTVVSDIKIYADLVALNGLLVMDDSANYLKIPDGLIRMDWRGLMDVSNAVRDHLETDSRFVHLFNVGHNRVWRRVA